MKYEWHVLCDPLHVTYFMNVWHVLCYDMFMLWILLWLSCPMMHNAFKWRVMHTTLAWLLHEYCYAMYVFVRLASCFYATILNYNDLMHLVYSRTSRYFYVIMNKHMHYHIYICHDIIWARYVSHHFHIIFVQIFFWS